MSDNTTDQVDPTRGGSGCPARLSPGSPETPEPLDLSARMLNEFVYCPRLFYYEFVEGVFVHNADTLRGAQIHRRVDGGSGKMPPAGGKPDPAAESAAAPEPTAADQAAAGGADLIGELPKEGQEDSPDLAAARERGELIHSRSVWLSSARFNLNAKLDVVESREAAAADGRRATVPVDYKKGTPREGEDGNEIWDADRMQLGLQMLILRENGYDCTEGVIYYQQTRQRVRLAWTGDLETWIIRTAAEARALLTSRRIPPPLFHSPKCVRCSLAGVCLPDETTMLKASADADNPVEGARANPADREAAADGSGPVSRLPNSGPPSRLPVRLLMASRDERRALYLTTPGLWVGVKSERLEIREKDKLIDDVRLRDVNHLSLFGGIQLSTQAIQRLCALEIPIAYFSAGGWFYGLTRGHGLTNVHTRIEQFRRAGDPEGSLALAKQFIHGKIKNQRTLLMRNHLELPDAPNLRLKQAAQDVWGARNAGELLGMEGAAAAVYFAQFGGMIKAGGGGSHAGSPKNEADWRTFDFNGRNRRPPRDPVNALLSLAYSLLAKDCMLSALTVGFDPYVGFFHQPRAGRAALALDLQEEFRPLVADSVVLSALNNRMLEPSDFIRAGDAVNLSPTGRKRFFDCYEKRMNDNLRHPVFNYQVSYRRAIELQARLLAKTLIGEIAEYRALTTR